MFQLLPVSLIVLQCSVKCSWEVHLLRTLHVITVGVIHFIIRFTDIKVFYFHADDLFVWSWTVSVEPFVKSVQYELCGETHYRDDGLQVHVQVL